MELKASLEQIITCASDQHLCRHFLLLAEDADKLGDTHLARHFLEIAMELYDVALQPNHEVPTSN